MKKHKQIISLAVLFLWFWFLSASASGIQIKTTSPYPDVGNTASWHKEDLFTIYSSGFIVEQSGDKSSFTLKVRSWFTLPTFLYSDQYGDFQVPSNSFSMNFTETTPAHGNCDPWETVSYYMSWNSMLDSEFWWDLLIQASGSYYCPASQKFWFTAFGSKLRTIRVEWKAWDGDMLTWNTSKIQVSGATSTLQTDATESKFTSWDEAVRQQSNFVKVDAKMDANLLSLNATINRNIINMTKGRTAENKKSPPIWLSTKTSFNNEFLYYDYTWEEWSLSNGANKGQILTLWSLSLTWSKMSVIGENTLIVQWGNLFIRNDIHNTNDTSSVLTIIVKRDTKNKWNWWNVYIHPNVTNIDAIIVADGSILSYNGFSVLSSDIATNVVDLRRQLLIYGAVNTKNTLSDTAAAPFWSDEPWMGNPAKYNLWNLRAFQPVRSEQITTWSSWCTSPSTSQIVALWESTNNITQYAFAGKKQCFHNGTSLSVWTWNLRTTPKLAWVVVEYNPILQTKPPRILQN